MRLVPRLCVAVSLQKPLVLFLLPLHPRHQALGRIYHKGAHVFFISGQKGVVQCLALQGSMSHIRSSYKILLSMP